MLTQFAMPDGTPTPESIPGPTADGLESDLRESRERLALAIDAADLGYWAWDPRDDLMTLSPRVAAIFGVPADKIITRTDIRNLVHPEEREIARAANERAMREGVDYDMEYRVIRPDGVTPRALASRHIRLVSSAATTSAVASSAASRGGASPTSPMGVPARMSRPVTSSYSQLARSPYCRQGSPLRCTRER